MLSLFPCEKAHTEVDLGWASGSRENLKLLAAIATCIENPRGHDRWEVKFALSKNRSGLKERGISAVFVFVFVFIIGQDRTSLD